MSSITDCGPGHVFDYNNTCVCLPLPGSQDADQHQTKMISADDDDDDDDDESVLGWEMIMIITLGSLLIILSVIVMGLMIRLRTLRKRADAGQSMVPSTVSGQYFPCSDPCTDLTAPGEKLVPGSSSSESGSEREKVLTDSSLCSDQEKWSHSSDSLHKHSTAPCLESVHLNSNLAIRCSNDQHYPTVDKIYSGSQHNQDKIYSDSQQNVDRIYSGSQHYQDRIYGGSQHNVDYGRIYSGSQQDVDYAPQYSAYSTLRRANPSNYNAVKIVYTNGDRSTELTCLMDPNTTEQPCNITPNPLNVYSM